MNNDILSGKIQEKYEMAINQLLKKIPEYQDLELKEIQFKATLKFIKRPVIGQKEETNVIQDTLSSIAECMAFQDKWCEKEIGKDGNFDYCEVQIEAFYYEEYKGKAISFKIPELSFEYVQK
jgi:hypothetical protein